MIATILTIALALTMLLLALAVYVILRLALRTVAQDRLISDMEANAKRADANALEREKLISRQRIVIIESREIIAEQTERLEYYDRVQKRSMHRLVMASPVLKVDDPLKYGVEAYMN